jgi:hypothetical protein
MRGVAVCAFLFLVAHACVLNGQSVKASLTGRITDQSKALITGARLVAIRTSTNVIYETTTNEQGEYYLSNLPPDSYHIEIEKPGFKKLIKSEVILHVQDTLRIDFEMTVGEVSEAVTIGGDTPLLNTASGTVSTVVDDTFVDNLPLNGRTFQTLIELTPGVVATATSFNDQGQFSVNGQRADANYFTVDGVSANFGVTGLLQMVQDASGALPALSASGGTNSLVSVDAMQEFRIQTSSFAPEFGRMPGGQVSIVTRSGTNQFHGSLFEYFRNDVLDASSWFVNANRLTKPRERQNDFGGVFGGPVIKNRTFFFFSYEGLRLRQPSTQQSVVPDNQSRQVAPATMRPYLIAFPVPNGSSLGSGLAQFNASFSNPSSLDAYSIRFDHVLNSKNSLFARYNFSPSSLDQRSPPFAGPILSMTNSLSSSVHTFTAGFTQLINPRISNEIRANYSNDRILVRWVMDNFSGAVAPADSVLFPTGVSSDNALFGLNISGIGQYNQGLQGTSEQRQVNLIDDLSLTLGSHQSKFGVDYRWLAPFSSPFSYRQFAVFSGMSAAPGGALSGTASLAATFALQSNALLSQNFSLYGQDTWTVGPRLTLTYGLRWDVNPAIKGKSSSDDPFTVTGLNDPATIALASRGTPLYETTYGNVAPRIGLAYRFRGIHNLDAVLRAGFGLFYDLGQGSLGGVSSFFPYIAVKIISPSPTAFPLTAPNAAPPLLSTDPPVTTMLVADPHLKLPRTYQWNVAVEQSIRKSQTLSLTYVGAIGRDLLRTVTLNVSQNFQTVQLTDNSATSDYHALQIKFQRRLSRGFQGLGSYTFSHSIDISSTDAGNNRSTPTTISSPNLDRGDSDFDIRHTFTAGVTYDLPLFGSNKSLHAVLGGWSLNSFVFARSAAPVDIVGRSFSAGGVRLDARPDVNTSLPLELFGSQYAGGKILNRAAFSAAAAGQQGSLGRNVLRGFGAWQADVAAERLFHLNERIGLRFRAEFFNIFNHPNFGNPVNTLTSPLFGRSTQTLANSLGSGGANGGLNPLYQIGGPRSIQFALKFQF